MSIASSQTAGIVLLKSWAMIPCLKMYQKHALVAFHTKNRFEFVHFSSRCRKLGHKDLGRRLHYMLLRAAMSLWGRFVEYSASWALGDRGPELQVEQCLSPGKPGLKDFRVDDAVPVQIQFLQSGVLLHGLGQGLTRRQMTAETRSANPQNLRDKVSGSKTWSNHRRSISLSVLPSNMNCWL